MRNHKTRLNNTTNLDEESAMKKKAVGVRNLQVVRILRVIRILENYPQGISVEETHEILQDDDIICDKRTVYRDLQAIQDSHFPIENFKTETGEAKWRFSSVAVINSKIQISYNEIVALYISRECLEPLKGTPIYADIRSFFDKISKLLGPGSLKELQNLKETITFKAKPSWTTGIKQEVLDVVHSACLEGHIIRIEYRSNSDRNRGQISERKVGPLGILLSDSSIYLIAKDFSDNVVKKFSIVRILNAIWTEEAFENKGFSLDDHFKSDFGMLSLGPVENVVISIKEPMASYVAERRWHETQKFIRKSDGELELTLDVRVNKELARWILGLGPEARVIAPKSLQDILVDMLAKLDLQYRVKGMSKAS